MVVCARTTLASQLLMFSLFLLQFSIDGIEWYCSAIEPRDPYRSSLPEIHICTAAGRRGSFSISGIASCSRAVALCDLAIVALLFS